MEYMDKAEDSDAELEKRLRKELIFQELSNKLGQSAAQAGSIGGKTADPIDLSADKDPRSSALEIQSFAITHFGLVDC
jgi:hypothetical protein